MSDLELVGKMNPRPFVSLAKEERLRIEEIKKRLLKKGPVSKIEIESELELTYERDVQLKYE